MAKLKTEYICQECGFVSPKWAGKCSECGAWSSFVEEVTEKLSKSEAANIKPSFVSKVSAVSLKGIKGLETDRFVSGMRELDQVLGGGLVKGSVTLIGGEPGIGKSTIMMQLAGILSRNNKNLLYVSGEESPEQLKMRSDRLGTITDTIDVLATNAFEELLSAANEKKYDYIILDSVQTVASTELSGAPGTVGQVKNVTFRLVELAKSRGITALIVGQVTKDGYIAGPKVLEHLVDTVLYFEGDYSRGIRILRSVKNRFGPANEVGLFEMSDKGLLELRDANMLFDGDNVSPGKVIAPVVEGTRAFLVEIQALVSPTFYQFPKRISNGFDLNRLNMLLAVLDKKGGLNLNGCDVYLNVAGGMKISETSADLAVCAAVISSFREKAVPSDSVFIGEVGLTGEVRKVASMHSRIAEATRFGIKKYYLPEDASISDKGYVFSAKNIVEFLDKF